MYDHSLEQLIDAVIADGIITDQERKVVYKKAASLGIDQDEIEVYLDGRLDSFKNSNAPKSGKQGGVRICPNCGANIGSFAAKCPECGHEISDITGNSAVKELMKKLNDVEKLKREKKGFLDDPEDEIEEKKEEIISLFPVPNTKEDLIEFATLCKAKLVDSPAWYGKASQIIDKANALFPDDPAVQGIIKGLQKEKKSSGPTTWIIIFIVLCVLILGLVWYFEK